MRRLNEFFKSTVLGGALVILPVALLLFLVSWLLGIIRGLIEPITGLIIKQFEFPPIMADMIVISVLLLLCFAVGTVVRTKLGDWVYRYTETSLLMKIPGYSMIKETITQFFGKKQSPFSSVALVQIFANETLVTGFVTDEQPDGTCTVFVPTGPNPTSGNIYHLQGKYVHRIQTPVEDAMRSIIGCGGGSTKLLNAYSQNPT